MKIKRYYFVVVAVLFTSIIFSQNVDTLNKFKVAKDILWASPDGFDLTMDIYSPETDVENLPVLMIFHGGGWLINNKSIMDQLSQYVVEHGDYVVCNVNYRLLGDQNNSVTLNQIIEDAFGAVLWVKEHISEYHGDPEKIAVTGDSAGGHLAASVVVMGHYLNSTGFTEKPLGYRPSYLPEGKTAEHVAEANGMSVQAAILSYGAFDLYASCLEGNFEGPQNIFWQLGGATPRGIFGKEINVNDHPEYYKAISPIYNIPQATDRKLPPQLFTVGSKDNLTTPFLVQTYMNKVKAAGHEVEYWEHEGRPHAFLDSGSNPYLGTSFEKDAPIAIKRMLVFLNKVFY